MLLIAQPKSSSTSLMHSLSQITKIPHKNGQNRGKDDIKCLGFEELQKYHGTTVKRNYKYLEKYIKGRIIYKEHILPIKYHIDIIKKIGLPVVVLLRRPDETVESYRRVFSVLPELNIDYQKLLEDVTLFYNSYMNIIDDLFLKITFRDSVFDFTNTVKKILKHWKLDIPKDIDKYILAKRNFTGHGLRKILEDKI